MNIASLDDNNSINTVQSSSSSSSAQGLGGISPLPANLVLPVQDPTVNALPGVDPTPNVSTQSAQRAARNVGNYI